MSRRHLTTGCGCCAWQWIPGTAGLVLTSSQHSSRVPLCVRSLGQSSRLCWVHMTLVQFTPAHHPALEDLAASASHTEPIPLSVEDVEAIQRQMLVPPFGCGSPSVWTALLLLLLAALSEWANVRMQAHLVMWRALNQQVLYERPAV